MATKAMKIWGTKVNFNGYFIGEIEDIGEGDQSRNLIKIFTCDSADETAEFLTSGIEPGQLSFRCVFDGEVGGTYALLLADFKAGTIATLEITYKNGAKKSINAMIIKHPTAGGAAEGGHAIFNVTFQLSGSLTYTPV